MNDIDFNREMDYDMMIDELLSMGEDIDEQIIEEAITEKNNYDKMLKYAVRSEDIYMKNKNCNYNDYSILNYISGHNPNEEHRYIYRKDVLKDKTKIEELSGKKIENYFKSINKIIKLGDLIVPKDVNGEIVYIINNKDINNRKYVLLEKDIIRYLIDVGNKYLTKLYILLKYRCNTKTYTKISRKDIAENIGLSVNSGSTLTKITNLIVALKNHNLIESYTEYDNKVNTDGKIKFAKHINIKLTTYEYWKDKYEEAKNNKKQI